MSVFSLGLHLLTWPADAVSGFLLLMLNDLISKKALEPTYTIGVGGSWFSEYTPMLFSKRWLVEIASTHYVQVVSRVSVPSWGNDVPV